MKESYYEFTEACDEAEAWLSLAIIKINVVEEMKHKLNKMRDQFKKWKTTAIWQQKGSFLLNQKI